MDSKFFTNKPNQTLYDRFNQALKHTEHFDILVGYFRSSGFFRLKHQFDNINKIRILVGLNVDNKIMDSIDIINKTADEFKFLSDDKVKEKAEIKICEEIELAEDSYEVEKGITDFIKFIKSGKIEIKAHPSQNIHAKVYIMRHPEDSLDFGRVITGSSNFSDNGLASQREFNVELKDRPDVEFALNQFEELWNEGVDISQDYVNIIENKSSLREDITPYDLYIKFLYEYFKEEINDDKNISLKTPEGFMELDYQKNAVNNARRILNNYSGVFLSDVVGLGKTFITALLLQTYTKEKKLILCPPTLKDGWENALRDFSVVDFKVESTGMLHKIAEKNFNQYDIIIIDEAHSFRNDMSQQFEYLHAICKNKKVILVSATPLNNSIKDIENLLSLFLNMKDSPISGLRNLTKFFQVLQKRIKDCPKGSQEYIDSVRSTSSEVREKILSELMVRRTRTDIKKYFSKDIKNQGLSFPTIEKPERIIYNFDKKTDNIFNETLQLISKLSYSRYKPLVYLKEPLEMFEQTSQENAKGFMKVLLLKRLESSFEAFKMTIDRFIQSHNSFIKMFNDGTVYIGNNKVFDWIESDDFEKIESKIENEDLKEYKSDEFNDGLMTALSSDLNILLEIKKLWGAMTKDPKIDSFIKYIKDNQLDKNKLIVFTESKETADYLYSSLYNDYQSSVMSFSGSGGYINNKILDVLTAKDHIEANFNPSYKNSDLKDDIRILITTDILAEGVNMHRANLLINYDLPWNPTKILQRVGRVNRVGTKHKKVHIFNIFPTSESDKHLGLEDNIISKINAFHSALGEDAKYLSEDREVIEQHGLLGDKLFDNIDNAKVEEDDESPRLKYLNIIRNIRDNDEELYVKIKNFPKKIRSTQRNHGIETDSLLTFFRKGVLKRFIWTGDRTGTEELTFEGAISKLEVKKSESALKLNDNFYNLIQKNKEYLAELTKGEEHLSEQVEKGRSNIKTIIERLSIEMKSPTWTDDEYFKIKDAKKAFEDGAVSKFTAKKMMADIKSNKSSIIKILDDYKKFINIRETIKKSEAQNEVVLSKLFKGEASK
jgi:superfamily II DNA/RNA helicase